MGKGHVLESIADARAIVVSSGRGVHEALAAAALCKAQGVRVGVVDMPSIDEGLLVELSQSGALLCLAEQNNGFILQKLLRVLHRRQVQVPGRLLTINTLDSAGKPQFIHSGTYEELIAAFGLTPAAIAGAIRARLA
jgi:transketolase C-terminal domain/subunit